jgi:hypothetical protein
MRRRQIAWLVLGSIGIAVFWPWLGNPFNYRHLKDGLRTSVPIAIVYGDPCSIRKDDVIYHDDSPNCYRFAEPKRYRGIWLYEFEGSTFLEDATAVPTKRPSYGSTAWLMYNPEKIDPKPRYDDYESGRDCFAIHAFEIEFIGHRSLEGHGHMGLFGSEIWVQKMLLAKPLRSPDCATY